MGDLWTVLAILALVVTALAIIVTAIWASSRGVAVPAIAAGCVLVGVATTELSGHLVRDAWTIPRLGAGVAFLALGFAAGRAETRPVVERALLVLAGSVFAASCAGLWGAHPHRAAVVAWVGLFYVAITVGQALGAGLIGGFWLVLSLVAGHVPPGDRLWNGLWAIVAIGLSLGAMRWPASPTLRRSAMVVIVGSLIWAAMTGQLTTRLLPAQDAAMGLAFYCLLPKSVRPADPTPATASI